MLSYHDGVKWHRNETCLTVRSMGKDFEVMAIATTDDAANGFMATHTGAAVMACIGPFILLANRYEQKART